jgi:hypothetical protein
LRASHNADNAAFCRSCNGARCMQSGSSWMMRSIPICSDE